MAVFNFKCTVPPLIRYHLQDIVTDEYSCAIFECQINKDCRHNYIYKWYKDGKYIEPQARIKISANETRLNLEIPSVSVEDEGVYTIIIKADTKKLFSCANLYVGTLNNAYYTNREVLYMSPTPSRRIVEKGLTDVKIEAGDSIELEVIFDYETNEEYLWFKSNKPIEKNMRTLILNDNKSSVLFIMGAQEADTGIYHVVSKTKYGIVSSFATVVVTDVDIEYSCEIIPCVIDRLPDTIDKNEGEETRLTCKALYDKNTVVLWLKNEELIQFNENIFVDNHDFKVTTLKLLNPNPSDTGKYTVVLKNSDAGRIHKTSCHLIISPIVKERIKQVNIIKPLAHVISCFGSRILLTCSFDLGDALYYSVVWYIGQYKVERTNHRFTVFNSDGDFFLFIKHVEPSMAGEIICELNKVLPNKTLINKTTSHLSIVPRAFIEKEIQQRGVISKQLIFNYPIVKLAIPCRNKRAENVASPNSSASGSACAGPSKEDKSILMITYCRFDANSFYFDVYDNQSELSENHLEIFQICSRSHSLKIYWNGNNSLLMDNKWYSIDFSQCGSQLITAGISSLPNFELTDPPAEQVMQFRITAVDPFSSFSESTVRIYPTRRDLNLKKAVCSPEPIHMFYSKYTDTGELIGSGAFGSVKLVHNQQNIYYAAKRIRTRTQRKRDAAYREFEILKYLKHPKVIELFDCFVSKEKMVLVMEYLWGGELFERIVEEDHLKEADVVFYVRQLCEGIGYLHERRIVHLDLKPENIVCISPNSRQIKIIDLGLARVLLDANPINVVYGTRDYVAPEILNFERLSLACDMWSLGVVTYMLLSGILPFTGSDWLERSANITSANYNFDDIAFSDISDLAKSFIKNLLQLRPERRMNAFALVSHGWIREGPPIGAKPGHMKRTQDNLKSYLANYKAKWQKAGRVMVAAHRFRTHAGNDQASNVYSDSQTSSTSDQL